MSRNSSDRLLSILAKRKRICTPCLHRLSRSALQSRRSYATSSPSIGFISHPVFKQQYFLANDLWNGRDALWNANQAIHKSQWRSANFSQTVKSAAHRTNHDTREEDEPRTTRRRRKKDGATDSGPSLGEDTMPLDASSRLSNFSSKLPRNSLKQQFFTYLSLSKPRLTFLVVLTTTAAYTLFPVAVSPMSSSIALSPVTLFNLTAGTALSSACANALNMLFEPEHDAKMSRTRSRPLVRGLLTSRAAVLFAVVTGTTGLGLLHWGVDPTVAFLSGLNIVVYAAMYTPLKRIHPVNTWVGAIVGGIPPLMGWTAAAAQSSLTHDAGWRELLFDPDISLGGWLVAGLLFAWQFPHFNALSYTIRHEYAAAGYKMLASINPRKNGLIALRYSLLMFPICVGLTWVGVTNWAFLPVSTAVNAWMTREAWRFYRFEGGKGSARTLFWASVWHLPLVLVLAMAMKKGLWDRILYGGLDDEEWEEFSATNTPPVNRGYVGEDGAKGRSAVVA